MNQRQPRISEEQARELWQRALELQNAAEHRNPDPPALMPADKNDLSLSQVAAAAEGAGIDPDYVRMALAERQLPDAERIDPQLWSARWVKWILREADAIKLCWAMTLPATACSSTVYRTRPKRHSIPA